MSKYRDFIVEKENRFKRKRRRRRWMVITALVIVLAVVGVYRDVIEPERVVSVVSRAVSQIGGRKLPIYSVDRDDKKVALTFDAAWGAEDFDRIMEILDKHGVKVTFFMTGGWVEDYPECVKTLAEKGHELGNHSWHHYDMTTLSKDEMVAEIAKVDEQVKALTGYQIKVFRPPYGAYDNNVIEAAQESGHFAIQWSVDSLDWKDYGVSSIIRTVCEHDALGPGAIILCHNGAKYTADALDEMLTKLEEAGYEIVPVSDLLLAGDYEIDVTGKQIGK